jgi:uncharacterized protein YPO0396
MFLFLLACTIGSEGPATPGSVSALESKTVESIATKAGEVSNMARELEALSSKARTRIAAGSNPAEEVARMEQLMKNIETLEAELQATNTDMLNRLQSTEETRK